MEMNFPHKSQALNDERNAVSEAFLQSEHNALLAHVIARQSLSQSARAIVAHRIELSAAIANKTGRSLNNRIRFFAGSGANRNADLFIRGHFRPDIAEQSSRGTMHD